ncbi:MAG: beta-lactamase family protein [Alphaproteobacteria bacterium]|jgi:CubicO group peptidase (beta-lactamase class C family)|nr:beta-lactamase family protein [Alphaproteobacteria bacterium]MBU2042988.1 beta-lactamase family protein [Alphaproteobacteria bacterium]MBU2124868.1 beta-lactamase family protein [Alphaproteobacteria bacterium]MBU2208347.1 beta-lactamase family protein [Alphaproteobacteria bacterium]MBU2291413.1 beta-lactamase family protein [Alphaproteobacteria bacterium]
MTRLFRLAALVAAAALLAASPAVAAPDVVRFRSDTDAFIRRAMDRIGVVPGLAIAVVDGDEAVLIAGYGVADLATGAAVDADTRFYIASSTKSFTALALAAMSARGEVDRAAPLSAWSSVPGLPADVADRVSLTDLLSHRSGLDNLPLSFRAAFSGDHTPEVMQRLIAATTTLDDAPYGTFRYSNAGYNLATTLLEARDGRDWRLVVRDEVLNPLGMVHTTGWLSEARADGAVIAAGHLGHPLAGPVRSPLQKTDATMQSAGGLVSTPGDMARWLEVQINDGVLDGRRVFPEGLVASTHQPLAANETTFGPYRRESYGLGWQIGRYGDDVLIHHFGNFSGSRAHVSFMPARRLGVVVMVNEDVLAGGLADVVANYVYDWRAARPDLEAFYDAAVAGLVDRRDQGRAAIARQQAERAARPSMLSRPLSVYAGTYESPQLGTVRVAERDGAMIVSMGVMEAVAESFTQPETVRVELAPMQGQVIQFGGDGEAPDRLVIVGETFLRR